MELNEHQEFISKYLALLTQSRHEDKSVKEPCSISHLLQNHGKFFTPGGKCRHGKIQQCYMNTFHLAEGSKFIYCEGMAMGIIPTMHGWCVDADGLVYDPTWKDDCLAYFGVRLRLDYVMKTIFKKQTYGVLDNWESNWPILRDDPMKWKFLVEGENDASSKASKSSDIELNNQVS